MMVGRSIADDLLDLQAARLLEKDEEIRNLKVRNRMLVTKLAILQAHLIERTGGWAKREWRDEAP
jgi:hypothetical protein